VSVRFKVMLLVLAAVTSCSAVFSYLLYNTQKSEYIAGINSKLYSSAVMARSIVGSNYHDLIVDSNSISIADYSQTIDTYNQICLNTGLQYLWSSLVLPDGSIRFTSATSTSKDIKNGDYAAFFDKHTDLAAYDAVVRLNKVTYATFQNEWGKGQMVMVPFKDKFGRLYVFGASISASEFDARINDTIMMAMGSFAILFAIGILVSAFVASTISKPINHLISAIKEITAGNYDVPLDSSTGGKELESLFVNTKLMRDNFKLKYNILESDLYDLDKQIIERTAKLEALQIALQDSDEKYRNIFETVPVSILIVDAEGIIVDINPYHVKHVGRGVIVKGDYVGQDLGNHPTIINSGHADSYRGVLDGNKFDLKCVHFPVTSDGLGGVFNIRGTPLIVNRQVTGAVFVQEDITLQVKTEQELVKSHALLKAVIEQAPIPLAIAKPTGDLTFNTACAEHLGFAGNLDIVQGANLFDLEPTWKDYDTQGNLLMGEDLPLAQALQGHTTTGLEIRVIRSDGAEKWEIVNAAPIYGPDGELIAGFVAFPDITDLKIAEKEKDRLQRELLQTHKMEALGQLTGGIAHDFNNILAIIIGNLELLLRRGNSKFSAEVLGHLNITMQASERAKELIAQMLTFSRDQKGSEQYIQLATFVNENLKMMKSVFPSSIRMAFECKDNLPDVAINPAQLQQILMNLCVNAKDALKGDGKLNIRLDIEQDMDCKCSTCLKNISGNWIELSVSDTGCGMSDNIIERIFDPFYTTKEIGEGTGMGLAVVNRIIHNCQGHVIVESEPETGSTFRLLFKPSNEDRAIEREDVKSSIASPAASLTENSNKRILVLDDEEGIADYIADLLELSGYQSTTITNSVEAMNLLLSKPDLFDLLVTDQTMPEIKGTDLTRKLKELNPDFPVILCTGNSAAIDIKKDEWNNFFILDKPIISDRFLSLVNKLLYL